MPAQDPLSAAQECVAYWRSLAQTWRDIARTHQPHTYDQRAARLRAQVFEDCASKLAWMIGPQPDEPAKLRQKAGQSGTTPVPARSTA